MFQVSLFAELFNEMLMRDFGFNIYKALCAAPEKPKEEKKDKKKDKDTEVTPPITEPTRYHININDTVELGQT